jgi:FdhD protein
VRVEREDGRVEDDWVVAEEPLEIRLDGEPLMVTMRTPGDDRELAAGFLFTEGVVRTRDEIAALEPCRDPMAYDPDNRIDVTLTPEAAGRHDAHRRARRDFVAVAACGLCGKARIEDVFRRLPEIRSLAVARELIQSLPAEMRRHQRLFDKTGGIHAAALFDPAGELLAVREDVGRHNAVDKVIGHHLLAGDLPLRDHILVVSARAGFEIVQKAMAAAIPVLAAVGAASSLAVRMAREGGLELYTFVGEGRSNRHRPSPAPPTAAPGGPGS